MILVTGSTGTTGSELVRRLVANGVPVRALVRDPQRAARAIGALPPALEIVSGDFADRRSLDAAVAGVERVFLVSRADPRQVELQGNVVAAARRARVRHLVKLSAAGASVDAPLPLARWHAQTENDIIASGVPYTFLRPSMFMQFLLESASRIKSDGAFYAPLRDGKVAMVDARDIAAVAAVVLTTHGHEGKQYVVTGGEALSFTEVAIRLSRVLGRPVKYVDVPPEAARKDMLHSGVPGWLVDNLMTMMGLFASGAAAQVSTAVREVTGQAPRSFEQFARDFASAFRA